MSRHERSPVTGTVARKTVIPVTILLILIVPLRVGARQLAAAHDPMTDNPQLESKTGMAARVTR